MTTRAVIFDLDGTVCDARHREGLIPRGGSSRVAEGWDAFHAACIDDEPLPAIFLMRALQRGRMIIVVTGRSTSAEAQTREWLARHEAPHDLLIMRQPGDHRPNVALKVEAAQALAQRYAIELWFEDDEQVAAALREREIPVLLVAEGGDYHGGAP